MFHRILVAIDHSEINQSVFEAALALAKTTGARLMLLHVLSLDERPILNPPFYISGYASALTDEIIKQYQEEWAASEQRGLEKLRALTNEATTAGVSTEFTQNVGAPGQTICSIAQSWKADLVVIGRRGYSGLREMVLGSVSNYVLHHAPCSVLTVQAPAQKQPEALDANQVALINQVK
jgi:nucleotide-binding universal stress UspA family protein